MTLTCTVIRAGPPSCACYSGALCANWGHAVSPHPSSPYPALGQGHSDLHTWERPGGGEGPPSPSWQQTAGHSPGATSHSFPCAHLAPQKAGLRGTDPLFLRPSAGEGWCTRSPRDGPVSPGITWLRSSPWVGGWGVGVESASVAQGALEPSLCRCSLTSLFQVLIKTKGYSGSPEQDMEE